MNYKIRITEDNQAIVKRIADENGMNPHDFKFDSGFYLYEIQNNQFVYMGTIQKGEEETILTTEKFIEMFDKKEKLTYTEASKKEERITNAEIIKSMNESTEERKIIAYKAPFDFVWGGVKKGDIAIRDEFQPYVYNVGISARIAMEIVETWEPVFEPLPIEQPKETDFKSKVIELIEKNINDKQQKLEFVIDKNNLIYEAVLECIVAIQKDLLNKIKEL